MEAPIIVIETIQLVPGYKIKHTSSIDVNAPQYADFKAAATKALIDFMNEDGRFGNLDAGEYVVRFKPLEVEVLVK